MTIRIKLSQKSIISTPPQQCQMIMCMISRILEGEKVSSHPILLNGFFHSTLLESIVPLLLKGVPIKFDHIIEIHIGDIIQTSCSNKVCDFTMQRTRAQLTPRKNGCRLISFAPSREPNLFLGSLCSNRYINCFALRLTCTKTKYVNALAF